MELAGKGNDILDKAEDVILQGVEKLLDTPEKLTTEAILNGINEFVQMRQGIGNELLDFASIVQQDRNSDGIDPLTLRNRTVLDIETIRIKFRYTEIEIDKTVRK